MTPPTQAALCPGFEDPVLMGQQTFRQALDAMARPGTITRPPLLQGAPAPLNPAAASLCLTLMDLDTPVHLSGAGMDSILAGYLKFHCGCPLVEDPASAAFGLVVDGNDDFRPERFSIGEPDYPDRSATLIIQVEKLGNQKSLRLSGPGIKDHAWLQVEGLNPAFWAACQNNRKLYPQGFDVFLAAPDCLAALPRTVKLEF